MIEAVDDALLEARLLEVGSAWPRAAGRDAQPAEGGRRQGDGARVAGRGAQGGAVPLRRRRAGVPLARRPRAPPDRVPRRGRGAAAAGRGRDADGRLARGARRARRGRGDRRQAHGAPLHRRRVARRPRWGRCASCGAAAIASSVDLLGEATVTQGEAQRYAERCDDALVTLAGAARDWPERPALERDGAGALPRANLSVKVSALTPLLRPDAPERGKRDAADRLRGLLRRARELGAHLHIDMESLDSRDAVLELVLELLAEPEFRDGPSAGMVLQAYLRDSPATLDTVLDWTAGAGAGRAHPLTVRLVKGAYWDHEIVEAAQHGWNAPVFDVKADSDRNFEQLTRRLLDARPALPRRDRVAQPALGRPRDRLRPAARRRRPRPRAAGPARARRPARRGDRRAGAARAHLLPGRRPRRGHGLPRAAAAGEHEQRVVPRRPGEGRAARGAAGAAAMKPFANEPVLELRRAPVRAQLADALAAHDAAGPLAVPVWIGDDTAGGRRARLDRPRRAGPRRRARRRRDRGRGRRRAGDGRRARAPGRRRPPPSRAEVLLGAAAWLRERRLAVAALEVRECAKPWPEADGDVCEAIDFLEYYARGAVELDGRRRAAAGPRRAQHAELPAARRRRRDRAVELPARDPVRDDRRRARHRQRRRAQARRAGAGLRLRARPGAARGGRPRRRARAAARRGRGRRRARRRPARAHDRVHRLLRGRAGDRPHRGRDAARPGPPQARDRRDGRQELRDRRRRRRPRRGRPRAREVGVRLRRPEVLGRRAGALPRGDPRRAGRAARRRRRRARGRAGRAARHRRPAGDRARGAGARRALRRRGGAHRPARRHRRGDPAAPAGSPSPALATELPRRLAGAAGGDLRAAARGRARRATSRTPATASTPPRSGSPAGCSPATPTPSTA